MQNAIAITINFSNDKFFEYQAHKKIILANEGNFAIQIVQKKQLTSVHSNDKLEESNQNKQTILTAKKNSNHQEEPNNEPVITDSQTKHKNSGLEDKSKILEQKRIECDSLKKKYDELDQEISKNNNEPNEKIKKNTRISMPLL